MLSLCCFLFPWKQLKKWVQAPVTKLASTYSLHSNWWLKMLNLPVNSSLRMWPQVLEIKLLNMVFKWASKSTRHNMQPAILPLSVAVTWFLSLSFLVYNKTGVLTLSGFYEETVKPTRGVMSTSNQNLVKMCQTLKILKWANNIAQHLNTNLHVLHKILELSPAQAEYLMHIPTCTTQTYLNTQTQFIKQGMISWNARKQRPN